MSHSLFHSIQAALTLSEYTPNPHVNAIMSQLVVSVTENTSPISVDEQTAIDIRNICSKTEYELELYWARLIANPSHEGMTLRDFPYVSNYQQLVERELQLLASTGLSLSSQRRILVIGSGPLPLSAYELHRQTGAQVDQVDSSSEAVQLGKRVCKALGMPTSRYIHADGQNVTLDTVYDMVLIAALAGSHASDKQRIIDTIKPHLAKGGRIILRTATGNRTLLYPEIKTDEITGVDLLMFYHPDDEIINSVYIYGGTQ